MLCITLRDPLRVVPFHSHFSMGLRPCVGNRDPHCRTTDEHVCSSNTSLVEFPAEICYVFGTHTQRACIHNIKYVVSIVVHLPRTVMVAGLLTVIKGKHWSSHKPKCLSVRVSASFVPSIILQ